MRVPTRSCVGLLCGLVVCLAGCSLAPVRPWEKGLLARPEMRFDHEPLEAMFAEHIYTSKEAAAGGQGVSGGGCGCN